MTVNGVIDSASLNGEALETIAGGGLKNVITFGVAGSNAGLLRRSVAGGALAKDDLKGFIRVMY